MQFATLVDLYDHFDQLVEIEASDNDLFASSYLRGFITLAAAEFGGEDQTISTVLTEKVTSALHDARAELTPDDRKIINEYWQSLQTRFPA